MVIGGQPIFTSETFQWRVLHTRENLFWTDSQGSGFAVTLGYTLSPLRGSMKTAY
jgi:hypothetical protein